MDLNEEKLHGFLGKMVNDLGAAASAALVLTGDKLGLYKTLVEEDPLTSAALAERTGTTERYVREWLAAQAASGYVEYDREQGSFYMTPEQAAVFADDESPFNMTGGFYALASVVNDEPKVTSAFQTGYGIKLGRIFVHTFSKSRELTQIQRVGHRVNILEDFSQAALTFPLQRINL